MTDVSVEELALFSVLQNKLGNKQAARWQQVLVGFLFYTEDGGDMFLRNIGVL
jgi:hypothetical protein